MSDSRQSDLESRVARLERLLDRVLELVQELRAEKGGQPLATVEEVPRGPLQAEGADSVEGGLGRAPEAARVEDSPGIGTAGIGEGEGTTPDRTSEAVPSGPGREPEPKLPDWFHPEAVGARESEKQRTGPGSGKETEPRGFLDLLSDLGIWPLTEVFLSRLGIGILLLAVAYFFKYSIDQGWLVPAVRLGIGVAAGIALVAMGFRGASKGEPLGTALAGGGIATFFITGYTGHQWYSLVSYPAAFGFLFAASALGILLSLRSGLQALAIVGMIGALATPLLLTAQTAEVAGLALYVSLIVASVGAIYMARAWRAVLLLAVVTAWMVLYLAVSQAASQSTSSAWVVQGGIVFCALVFWLIPLLRAELRAGSPGRWLRPESAYPEGGDAAERDPAEGDAAERGAEEGGAAGFGSAPPPPSGTWSHRRSAAGTAYVPWSAHLDALSLLMPVVAITFSTWLWDLSRVQLGWVFFGAALLAQGIGLWISRSHNPEDSASTQWFVAILLSTVGLGLVLKGDVLYLAFIAEAVALMTVGSRKESKVVLGLGLVMELVVFTLFISRLALGGTFLDGDLSSFFDLAAIGGAAFIGTRLHLSRGRRGFFIGAYLALLAFTARELTGHLSFLYLAFLVEAVATHVVADRREDRFLELLGHVAFGLVVVFFAFGIQSGRTFLGGDLTLLVDIAALMGAVFVGTLATNPDVRKGLFAGAYLGLMALLGRELAGHLSVLYLIFVLGAVVTQVMAVRRKSSFFSALGHVPAFLALGFFANGMETGRNLLAGDLTSLVDLVALGGAAYIGALLTGRQGRVAYFFAAYAGLLLWTGRELEPLEQGQALMSLAFGLEGTVLLVAGFLMDRSLLQKTGMATLLMVVVKVLLVDLAAVEPIWRVLLLFVFGGLFLLLSRFVRGRRAVGPEAREPSPEGEGS